MNFGVFGNHALWSLVQEAYKVKRWGKAEGYEQNLIQHISSFYFTARAAREALPHDLDFDEQFFFDCVMVHDLGEVLLARDTWGPGKTPADDFDEYVAFRDFLKEQNIPLVRCQRWQRAFLLQFVAGEEYQAFPDQLAQDRLRNLKEYWWLEACAFSLAEILDYFQSALAGTQQKAINATRHYGRRPILQATWLDQEARADALVLKAPQLSVLWNDEVKQRILAAIDLEREAHRPR